VAYGILANTSAGIVDVTTIRALRVVHSRQCSGRSGSYSVAASIAQNAFPSVEVQDGKAPPRVWMTSATIRWAVPWGMQDAEVSSSFKINLLKMV